MSATAIDRLYDEFSALLKALDTNDVSLRSVAEDNFRKVLLIAAASHFERLMTDAVLEFAKGATAEDHPLTWLIRNKMVSRQYHTWFNWDARNANRFFKLFGETFREHMETEVEKVASLKSSIQAFLEIGSERNRLIHEDFATFSLEKTSKEIYGLYDAAKRFVEWFPDALQKFTEANISA